MYTILYIILGIAILVIASLFSYFLGIDSSDKHHKESINVREDYIKGLNRQIKTLESLNKDYKELIDSIYDTVH